MKTVITAINSKYIHSSLAAWYLKTNCSASCGQVEVSEYTINDSIDNILISLYQKKADIIAFSCYIWNYEIVLKLSASLKKVCPQILIVLGGPEVSYNAVQILENNSNVDYIISGEGEDALNSLLYSLNLNQPILLDKIEGLYYRNKNKVNGLGGFSLVKNLETIKSPYTEEMLQAIGSRIVYFESSRGCPFSCSYCISSTFEGVRYFSMERVKSELKGLINKGVRQIKFVDRTFNSHKQRAKEIFEYVIQNSVKTTFHFEVAADLFDEEMFNVLSKAPKGLIQFEIGVQTVNADTLNSINRKTDLSLVFKNVTRLISMGLFHIHLDLIAGLPKEDYESFKYSFDTVYRLKPHNLQLGFLKMLKGSSILCNADIEGYKYKEYAPYEVLENKYITFDTLCELKKVEEIVERYYNQGRFIKTLDYVIANHYKTPFEFYYSFMKYNSENGYLNRPLAARELYDVLYGFLVKTMDNEKLFYLKNLMKLDFLLSDNSSNLPRCLSRTFEDNFKYKCLEFLKKTENIKEYIPSYAGMSPVQIFKHIHFEVFDYDITAENIILKDRCEILIDYGKRDQVSGLYEFYPVQL